MKEISWDMTGYILQSLYYTSIVDLASMNKNCVRKHKKNFCISEPHSYAKDQINIYTSFWVAVYTPDILNSFFSQGVIV